MKNPREKYLNDNMYRRLVDMMVDQINQCMYTPSEMREAAILASIIYEERKTSDLYKRMGDDEEVPSISCVGTILTPTRFDEAKEHED